MSKNNKGGGTIISNNESKATLSAKETRSIINIYIPEHMLGTCTDGYLVGYHFENTHYVISSIIPASAVDSLDKLSGLIRSSTKLNAFNRYCASDLKVLGIIEDALMVKSSLKHRIDVDKYRQQNINTWL